MAGSASSSHGVAATSRANRISSAKNPGWKLLAFGLAVFAIVSLVFLALASRDGDSPPLSSFHRRLSWSLNQIHSATLGINASLSEPRDELELAQLSDPLCPNCSTGEQEEREKPPTFFPSFPVPELAAVGFAMKKLYQILDHKARKQCGLRRVSQGISWNNHSNFDNLTRWRNPGIPGSAFDHSISFRYEKVKGTRAKLADYHCHLLLRGQDYEVLRSNPLVQSRPFTPDDLFGPLKPDGKLQMVAVVFPQYHAIEQNNRFWGTNFTEWTNLKLTFFNPWNFQPIKHPILEHDGYYNFLDYGHRKRVARLAKHYGIQALAYHHYWFDCNTVFLEQVVTRMMEDGQPNMPFMFIWANEAWTRHWTGETGEVLQTQGYGNSSCWEQHFDWLLPFFNNPKYLKVDGKPAFAVYLVSEMKPLQEMMGLWQGLALKAGLPGIHVIQCLGHKDRGASKHVDAIMEYQPNLKRGRLRSKFKDQRLHSVHYRGEYLGWDNYPRHNLEPKFVVGDFEDDPIHVESRLYQRMYLARKDPSAGTNLFFLVAWNEWGEGNILEPNNIFGYGNLNAVASAYRRSRSRERTDVQVLQDLLDLMDACKLKLDIEHYIDLSETKLDHLWKRRDPENEIVDNWEQKGYKKGREFRLMHDADAGSMPNISYCHTLSDVLLDRTVVRFYLDVVRIRNNTQIHAWARS